MSHRKTLRQEQPCHVPETKRTVGLELNGRDGGYRMMERQAGVGVGGGGRGQCYRAL